MGDMCALGIVTSALRHGLVMELGIHVRLKWKENRMSVENVGWFLAGAEFMAKTRPDLWNVTEALNVLSGWRRFLDDKNSDATFVGSGGFTLYRSVDSSDDSVSYELKMDVVDLTEYKDDTSFVFLWSKDRVSDSTVELIDNSIDFA